MKTKPRSRTKTIVRWVNWFSGEPSYIMHESKERAVEKALSFAPTYYNGTTPIPLPAPKKRRGL